MPGTDTVFVGIDVHKEKYVISAVVGKEVVFTCSMEAEPEVLIKTLKKRFSSQNIKSVYEAGFSGFKLHRELLKAKIDSIVVNASSIEVASNNKVKTDKRDAKKMALHLARGALRGITVPTEEQELKRQFHRTRDQLVRIRTKVGNQIKSKLTYFGIEGGYKNAVMSEKLTNEIRAYKMPEELHLALGALLDQWICTNNSIKVLLKKIKDENSKDDKAAIISSIPGVGEISANLVSTELGDIERFSSAKKLFSFAGLTPSEYSSGEHVRKGRISRQGPSRIRHVLIECAWRLIGKDKVAREKYEAIKHRRGSKKAIVAIARKLLGQIRACLLKNEYYQSDFQFG